MNIVSAATRAVAKTADVTTATAGAIGGAAVNGVVGGLQGAASGVRAGIGNGSHSTAAAALTLGAIGAAGLVEWPLLLTVGGGVLVVHQLSQRSNAADGKAPLSVVSGTDGESATTTTQPRKSTARKRTHSSRRPTKAASRASTRRSRTQ